MNTKALLKSVALEIVTFETESVSATLSVDNNFPQNLYTKTSTISDYDMENKFVLNALEEANKTVQNNGNTMFLFKRSFSYCKQYSQCVVRVYYKRIKFS